MEDAKDCEQNDRAKGRHDDGGQVETLHVVKAQQAADQESADEGADDPDNEVYQQPMVAAGNALGRPPGENANHDAGDDIYGRPLKAITQGDRLGNAFALGRFRGWRADAVGQVPLRTQHYL